jgi:hypothetical protein
LKKVSGTLRHQVFVLFFDASKVPDTFFEREFLQLLVNLGQSLNAEIPMRFPFPVFVVFEVLTMAAESQTLSLPSSYRQ